MNDTVDERRDKWTHIHSLVYLCAYSRRLPFNYRALHPTFDPTKIIMPAENVDYFIQGFYSF